MFEIVKVLYYKANGMGQFPIDMLRYDVCFIAPEHVVADDGHGQRGVHFRTQDVIVAFPTYRTKRGVSGRRVPTVGRWSSFMWRVVALQDEPDKLLGDDWVRYDWNGYNPSRKEKDWQTFAEFRAEQDGVRR